MTPDELDGAEVYRLDDPGEAEELARALEEAAARVRTWPPLVRSYDVSDDVELGEAGPDGRAPVLERRPRWRVFDLRWPT